jgi:hypothetical protein
MTDKELIKKLNSLKNIKPETAWMSGNRDLLLSQISNSGACDLSAWKLFSINFNSFVKVAAQPAYALGIFLFVLVSGGLFSHQVFNSAKPNDSLYIARIISEQARLSTVFNSDDRNKMAVQFSLDHAKDISTILADPSFNTEANKDQVAKLSETFNKEIENVKTRISYLSPKIDEEKNEVPAEVNSETAVFSMAGNEKDNQGLQVSETPVIENSPAIVEAPSSSALVAETEVSIATATLEMSTSSNAVTSSILDEAKQFSENKDYHRASEKLQEVSELIK